MPGCAKPEPCHDRRRRSAVMHFLAVIALSLPLATLAAAFQVQHVDTSQWGNRINVSAQIDLELSDEALRALDNGVALHFVLELQVLEARRWLWDRTLAKHVLDYQLERQALSNHYLVTHASDNIRQTFRSLPAALEYIGRLRDYPLVHSNELNAGADYYGRLRARLDIESLPAPMRPMAYVSSQWQLSSDWRHWPLRPATGSPAP